MDVFPFFKKKSVFLGFSLVRVCIRGGETFLLNLSLVLALLILEKNT